MKTTTQLTQPIQINWPFVRRSTLFASLITLGGYLLATAFIPFIIRWAYPYGGDWMRYFRPAIVTLFSGVSPYIITGFFSPPWVPVLLSPFALLSPGAGAVAIAIVGLSSWIFAMRRLGASVLVITMMLMTPNLLWGTTYANIDWMIPLGLVLPPQVGLFFVLAKPQAGVGIALFWLFEAWRRGGFREVMRVFAPIAIVSLAFLIPFGFWPLNLFNATAKYWNISPFPYLVPVGLIFLYRAIRDKQQGLAILAGPFISPYVTVLNLPVAILGLLPSQVETIIAILGLWIAWLIRGSL